MATVAILPDMSCRVDPGQGGNLISMDAQTPFNAADSATIFNALIAIWTAQANAIAAQLAALT